MDYAAALYVRFDSRGANVDSAGLYEVVRLTEQGLAASDGDPTLVARAHKLRGPMLIALDEIDPGAGALDSAAESFQVLADLCAPGDPMRDQHLARLRGTQELIRRRDV
ncbi:hypothetical protein [Actinoplanes sp. NPDC051859]|uniref:hypothetical protein n=1 Tax=Actinoplanes sp. NPDC051859 TaxID=3363909 RepID=UPI0037A255D8